MSDYTDYDALIAKLQAAQSGSNENFNKISNAAQSDCDINQIVENSGNITIVRNNNGDIIGYDNIYTIPSQPDTTDLQVNSNSDTGTYGTAQGGGGSTTGGGAGRGRHAMIANGSARYAGSYYTTQGNSDLEAGARDGNDNNINVVSGDISPAWAAVSALAKFGKNVSTAGNELIDGMATYLHDTFNAYMKLAGTGVDAFRTLFGLDNNGNVTMYMDEDTIGALAIAAKESGAFDIYDPANASPNNLPSGVSLSYNWYHKSYIYHSKEEIPFKMGWMNRPGYQVYDWNVTSNNPDIAFMFHGRQGNNNNTSYTNRPWLMAYSRSPITGVLYMYRANSSFQIIDETPVNTVYLSSSSIDLPDGTVGYYMYIRDLYAGRSDGTEFYIPNWTEEQKANTISYYASSNNNTTAMRDAAKIYFMGSTQGTYPPTGITDQTGATIPVDAITGADPHMVAQNLVTNYPSVMGSPIQIVVLDDSCNEKTINYYSIPISYGGGGLNVDAPITGGLQVNPSFNPDVQLDLPDIDMSRYVEEIINQLRGTGAGRNVVNTQVDPETGAEFPVVLPGSIPNTGSGVTPAWLPDDNVGSNIMWQVYNPTPATLRAFGSWLWSNGNIVTQFMKIMSNPMDAILGLHKVYVTPNRSGTATIVCGNLDSEVSSITVGNQYVEIDCGSVWITEYFGNVFDYSPYTDISVYLPFIGIVNVATNEVMRGEMSIKYTVDVYTGACIAEISINRDGVGGVLYQFNGNAAVEYPITAMSYNNAIMGALGIANGVLGAIPSIAMGNPIGVAGSFASSMIHATMGQRENVQRSGSFSGNAGAMGAKKPYVIITRPIPEMAYDFELWEGQSANTTVEIGDCSGFIKCRYFEAELGGMYKSEMDELYNLMQGGIIA